MINHCIRKTILSEDGPSPYNILRLSNSYSKYFYVCIAIKVIYFTIIVIGATRGGGRSPLQISLIDLELSLQ